MSGILDQLVLLYFVACGISRLARYNITAEAMSAETGKVTYFEGTPIPTSVLLVLLLLALAGAGRIGDALPFGSFSLGGAGLHPGAGVRAVRIADDQQDAPHPEALRPRAGSKVAARAR